MKKISEDYFIKKNDVDYNPTIESTLSQDEKILWRANIIRRLNQRYRKTKKYCGVLNQRKVPLC